MSADRPVLLVLDDDQELGVIIGAIAEQSGFTAVVTNNPGAFQDALSEYEASVVVLDLQMPELDGIQALRVLTGYEISGGILLVSGMDERTLLAAERHGKSQGLPMLGCLQKPFMPEELEEKLRLVRSSIGPVKGDDLKAAISNQEFAVHYQPTVRRFADGSWDIDSFEALVRWEHPSRGILTPDAFLDMSEELGMMGLMTDFVIERGVEDLRGWHTQRLNLGLRVNIAATLISDIAFPDRLEMLVSEQGLDPSSLTLEITETAMLSKYANTSDILTRLRVKDFKLAIDDFGIGSSSLTQLVRMPFNEMKIDKSLIVQVPESQEAKILVEALVDLAHKLKMDVCAEGVETEAALDFLDRIGCDSAQGFLIGRPIGAADVPAVIDRWDQRPRWQAGDSAS